MKEVEVGDEYDGKVVKTTTFGAFVELAKGTDGLLHISNVSPGERVESVEDVLNKGDEINVRVVEVDSERGRIGLRLAEDPDIAGKTVEELAGVGTGGGGGGGSRRAARRRRVATAAIASAARGPRREGDRGSGRPRRDRDRVAAERRAPASPRSTRACESSPSACRACARWRSASGSAPARSPSATSRRASRTCSSTCCSAAPSASARRRSTRSSTRWAPRSTPAPARRPRRSTRACSTGTSSARST